MGPQLAVAGRAGACCGAGNGITAAVWPALLPAPTVPCGGCRGAAGSVAAPVTGGAAPWVAAPWVGAPWVGVPGVGVPGVGAAGGCVPGGRIGAGAPAVPLPVAIVVGGAVGVSGVELNMPVANAITTPTVTSATAPIATILPMPPVGVSVATPEDTPADIAREAGGATEEAVLGAPSATLVITAAGVSGTGDRAGAAAGVPPVEADGRPPPIAPAGAPGGGATDAGGFERGGFEGGVTEVRAGDCGGAPDGGTTGGGATTAAGRDTGAGGSD